MSTPQETISNHNVFFIMSRTGLAFSICFASFILSSAHNIELKYSSLLILLLLHYCWLVYFGYGSFTRYVKLRVAYAPGMPGTCSPPPTSKEAAI